MARSRQACDCDYGDIEIVERHDMRCSSGERKGYRCECVLDGKGVLRQTSTPAYAMEHSTTQREKQHLGMAISSKKGYCVHR